MKGYVYTLEVLLSISLLTLTTAYLFSTMPEKPDLETSIIKEKSFETLRYLDNAGILRKYVANQSEAGIEGEIANILPVNLDFDIDICSTACTSTNIPGNRTVVSVDYYVSTYKDDYLGKKVKLWVWSII
jgi:hypothetical protein